MTRRFFPQPTPRRLVVVAAGFFALTLATPQVWAWYQFRTARSALDRHHPDEARRALSSCARVWGGRPSVHLLASRAARQDGDLTTAAKLLRVSQRLSGGATDATAFEWALLQASAGHVREVEEYLQKRAETAPSDAPLVWEALAEGYLRMYRTLDAMACVNHWLKRAPDDVRAIELRGQTYVIGKGVVRGAEDYRRVLELDPTRKATRWRLIDALLVLGSYDEAAGHLELLARDSPGDPEVAARLARCYYLLGRADEGRRMIDDALARHPNHGPCLRTRGQIELGAQRADAAEVALRRAVELMPQDYQSHQLLFISLQEQGKVGEAKARLAIAESVRDRFERIGELSSRKLAEFPLDPDLHAELGKLFLESGIADAGTQWLLSALSLDPDHHPAHAALAAYYDSVGDKARADEHRRKAAP